MDKRIKKIILKEAAFLHVSRPLLKDSREEYGGYSDGVLYIPEGMNFSDTLFLALHELYHHYQSEYVKNHEDSYKRRISYEMENYSLLSYDLLYMEDEAFFYAYLSIFKFMKKPYSPPLRIKERIHRFSMEYPGYFWVVYGNA